MLVDKASLKLGPFAHAFRHRGPHAQAACVRYASHEPKKFAETKQVSSRPLALRVFTVARQPVWSLTILIISAFLLLGFKVELKIDHGTGSFDFKHSAELKKGSTVFDLLSKEKEIGQLNFTYKDFGKMGVLIDSIDGYKNGKKRKYWKFWVNNKFSRVGASNYLLKHKDVVTWRYAK